MAITETSKNTQLPCVAATNDVRTYNNPTPITENITKVSVEAHRDYLTPDVPYIVGSKLANVNVSTRLQGTNVLGTTENGFTGVAALMAASGANVFATVPTDVVITPATKTQLRTQVGTIATNGLSGSMSCEAWHETKKHLAFGVLGNTVISATAGGTLDLNFTGTGCYDTVVDATAPTAWTGGTDYSAVQIGAGTTTIKAEAVTMSSFSFDFGAQVVPIPDLTAVEGLTYAITRRNPTLSVTFLKDSRNTGTLDPEDFYVDKAANTTHAIVINLNAGAATKDILFNFDHAEIMSVQDGVGAGYLTTTVNYRLTDPTTDAGDWLITIGS
jgi:hypothetical protein